MPEHIVKAFRALASESGPGSVKHLGTAAIALLLGMPQNVRDAVIARVQYTAWRTPRDLDPTQAWVALLAAIDSLEKTDHDDLVAHHLEEVDPNHMPSFDDLPPGTKFYIDKICSPDFLGSKTDLGPKAKKIDTSKIPPPEGKKASKGKTG